jgi:outer membrane protein TolC
MKQYKILIIGLLLCTFCLAQTPSIGLERADSLQSYLETAWRQNPSIQQKWNEYQAALEKVPQAAALPDPSLNLGLFLQPMELPGGNQVADVQLMQMFPWFGVLKNARDEMSLMAKASFTSVLSAKLDLAYAVRTTWYELYRNREQARLTDENIQVLSQLDRLALVRYGSGGVAVAAAGGMQATPTGSGGSTGSGSGMSSMSSGTTAAGTAPATTITGSANAAMPAGSGMASITSGLIALYDLQQEKLALQNRRSSLDDAFQNLCIRFNLLLNRETTVEIALPPSSYADPLQHPSDTTLTRNPMLQMLAFERESLEAKRKMTERMGYPMVGIGLKYSVMAKNPASTSMMNGQDMLMPMVSVSLPIFRKKYRAAQQETVWQQQASVQGFEATRNNLQSEYEDLKFQVRDADRRILLAESTLQLTQKSYQLQRGRFAASSATLEDVVNLAKKQLDETEQILNARVDKLIAQAGIRKLTAIE